MGFNSGFKGLKKVLEAVCGMKCYTIMVEGGILCLVIRLLKMMLECVLYLLTPRSKGPS